MGVDKLSSTPEEAAGTALDKGAAAVLVEKFRLLSMLFPCSLFNAPAAKDWRGALY
jgi:diacylglycerol kinase